MRVEELDYDLPAELIAQRPLPVRDESRLLVYDRMSEGVDHRTFADLPDVIGDALVVVNDTRVVPARIPIERPRGEVLLLERLDDDGLWEGLARPTRRLRAGRRYGPVELLEHLGEGRWRLRLSGEPAGQTPLPPYITEPLADPERYQTVYAREPGSAAAPTAGLHFTPRQLACLDVERKADFRVKRALRGESAGLGARGMHSPQLWCSPAAELSRGPSGAISPTDRRKEVSRCWRGYPG